MKAKRVKHYELLVFTTTVYGPWPMPNQRAFTKKVVGLKKILDILGRKLAEDHDAAVRTDYRLGTKP